MYFMQKEHPAVKAPPVSSDDDGILDIRWISPLCVIDRGSHRGYYSTTWIDQVRATCGVRMRKLPVRSLAAASALCVTAAFSGVGAATAETPSGVGTSKASTSILSLQLGKSGSLLNLRLLGDDAQSTIDSAVASPHSATQLVPLSLTSDVIPALNTLTAALPKFETRDPGGQRKVSGSALDLANPGGALGAAASALPAAVPTGVLGGKIVPAGLSSLLEGGVATSTLDAQLADLKVLFGALGVKSITNTLEATAGAPQAAGTRNVKIGAVSVLNLGELLKGLGIDLNNLPVATVSELVKSLQLPVELPTGEVTLASAIATIDEAIATVKATVATQGQPTLTEVVNTVPEVKSVVDGLPALLPVSKVTDVPATELLTQTVGTTLETLQATLTNLLNTALGLVGNTPLLTFEGADVSAVTKATDSVATSAADVTAKLGGVKVLGLGLPGVDLAGVGETVSTITNTLGNTLSIIDPSLKDLVGVDVLKKATSVTTSGGYVRSAASFDVLKVSVTPPAAIADLVGKLTGNSAASSTGILSGAGIANAASVLPVHGASMTKLAGALDLPAGVGALLEGLTLRLGSVQSNSDHIAASAPATPAAPVSAPAQQLPRTGSESTQMAAMALGLAALALGLRRFVLRPARG
jgi:LPXTG-motif cell wall-anchored protein